MSIEVYWTKRADANNDSLLDCILEMSASTISTRSTHSGGRLSLRPPLGYAEELSLACCRELRHTQEAGGEHTR